MCHTVRTLRTVILIVIVPVIIVVIITILSVVGIGIVYGLVIKGFLFHRLWMCGNPSAAVHARVSSAHAIAGVIKGALGRSDT